MLRCIIRHSTHSTWNFKIKAKNITVVLPSSPIFFLANRSRGSWVMIGHTNKQTDITTLYIYYIDMIILLKINKLKKLSWRFDKKYACVLIKYKNGGWKALFSSLKWECKHIENSWKQVIENTFMVESWILKETK